MIELKAYIIISILFISGYPELNCSIDSDYAKENGTYYFSKSQQELNLLRSILCSESEYLRRFVKVLISHSLWKAARNKQKCYLKCQL